MVLRQWNGLVHKLQGRPSFKQSVTNQLIEPGTELNTDMAFFI
jgi:hypothetical protein